MEIYLHLTVSVLHLIGVLELNERHLAYGLATGGSNNLIERQVQCS